MKKSVIVMAVVSLVGGVCMSFASLSAFAAEKPAHKVNPSNTILSTIKTDYPVLSSRMVQNFKPIELQVSGHEEIAFEVSPMLTSPTTRQYNELAVFDVSGSSVTNAFLISRTSTSQSSVIVESIASGKSEILTMSSRLPSLPSLPSAAGSPTLPEQGSSISPNVTPTVCYVCTHYTTVPGHISDDGSYTACDLGCELITGDLGVVACKAACFAAFWVPGYTYCDTLVESTNCPT